MLASVFVVSSASSEPQAIDITNPQPATTTARDLYLEVFINDASTNLIGNFKQLPDGQLGVTPQELSEVGLKPVDTAKADDGLIVIDRLPSVSFRVDEAAQRIFIATTDDARQAKVIDADTQDKRDRLEPRSSFGGVLNYSLFASSNTLFDKEADLFQGISGSFDARLFSPYGTLSQSFLAGYSDNDFNRFRRLKTTWAYSDSNRMVTYRAGDIISGGLAWTRPVYLGGMQIERNFALRPDLVTLPLPSFSGTAAVPSTLEIYTQNTRSYAGEVAAGPFEVVNIPAFTGQGQARVVIRDSLGRETATSLPYYSSNMLLRRGLLDFSAEIGFPRRNFGIESNNYDQRLMGSISARYGLTDWLTLEGHAEGGAELANGGAGIAFPLAGYGAASMAVAGSYHDGRSGSLVNAAVELGYEGWTFYGRIQRVFGNYQDIAAVTAEPALGRDGLPLFSAGVPRAIDQATLSIPMPLDLSSLTLSFTNFEDAEGERNRIVGVSYSQQIFERSTIYASAFKDIENEDSFGIFAGLSIPFDDNITASTGVENGPDGTRGFADLTKSEQFEDGSVGWRLRTSEGKTPHRSAAVSYRSSVGRAEAAVEQFDKDVRATAQLEGAIAVAGGGVFATNRIDDAFAVVDVGAPDVEVQYQNRPAGKTGRRGKIIVPDLRSYEDNTVSINPGNLPVDADIPATKEIVVPADRSGVVVDFGVSDRPAAALVSFVDAGGTPLPVSSTGTLSDNPDTFVIGYDGEAYVRALKTNNSVTIDLGNGNSCQATFPYRENPGKQVVIRKVVCQ